MHLKSIARMHTLPAQGQGMDVIIISVANAYQEHYWETKLKQGLGCLVRADAIVCCVSEDWPGGAGNGLGTLYTYVKAREKIQKQKGLDIWQFLQQGASIAVYHTTGIGKRLYPLAASECGNKAAVKLPSYGENGFLSILEGVIKQTSVFAPVRKGRLSVFWSDQIFIPSKPIETRSKSHIDILACMSKLPSEESWAAKKLSKYGCLAIDSEGQSHHVDKCSFSTIKKLKESKAIGFERGFGMSLGSFSLSHEMLAALLDEFAEELRIKKSKMDSDPHFWMPLTLPKEIYLELLAEDPSRVVEPEKHYQRMRDFKFRFGKSFGDNIFSVVDAGAECYWWDYGTTQSYIENNIKLCSVGPETEAMRAFLRIEEAISYANVQINRAENSVIVGVTAQELKVSHSIIINAEIASLEGDHLLIYNVKESEPLNYSPGLIRADVFLPPDFTKIKVFSTSGRDGKADWLELLEGNQYTYAQLQQMALHL